MKKKQFIAAVATFLMAYVAMVPRNISLWFIGEPKLPQKLEK